MCLRLIKCLLLYSYMSITLLRYVLIPCQVPSLPPSSLEVATVGTSSISATWGPVPHSHLNGILTAYRISYRIVGGAEQYSILNNASSTYELLENLRYSSQYCVRIFASTRVGEGPGTACQKAWTRTPGENSCR